MVQWNLPNDTGGAALVSVVVGLTGPSGKSLVAFKPETTNNTFKGLQPFSDYKLEFVTKNQVLESLPTILEAKTGEEGKTEFSIDCTNLIFFIFLFILRSPP